MEYIIKNKRSEMYIPRIDMWIIDDLKLKGIAAQLYSMVLQKGYLVWDYNYIGNILGCSKNAVCSTVKKLRELEMIHVTTKIYKTRPRTVLVALYTASGHRPEEEISNLSHQGIAKLDSYYANL